MTDEQKQLKMNIEAQLKQYQLHSAIYPVGTLKKPDGTYVHLWADGKETVIPKYVDYGEDL